MGGGRGSANRSKRQERLARRYVCAHTPGGAIAEGIAFQCATPGAVFTRGGSPLPMNELARFCVAAAHTVGGQFIA
jgi:hypothetical protein